MAVGIHSSVHVGDGDRIEARSNRDENASERTSWITIGGGLSLTTVSLHLSDAAADALMAALIDLARIRDTHALAAELAS